VAEAMVRVVVVTVVGDLAEVVSALAKVVVVTVAVAMVRVVVVTAVGELAEEVMVMVTAAEVLVEVMGEAILQT